MAVAKLLAVAQLVAAAVMGRGWLGNGGSSRAALNAAARLCCHCRSVVSPNDSSLVRSRWSVRWHASLVRAATVRGMSETFGCLAVSGLAPEMSVRSGGVLVRTTASTESSRAVVLVCDSCWTKVVPRVLDGGASAATDADVTAAAGAAAATAAAGGEGTGVAMCAAAMGCGSAAPLCSTYATRLPVVEEAAESIAAEAPSRSWPPPFNLVA